MWQAISARHESEAAALVGPRAENPGVLSMGSAGPRAPMERRRAADGSIRTTYRMWDYAREFGRGGSALR